MDQQQRKVIDFSSVSLKREKMSRPRAKIPSPNRGTSSSSSKEKQSKGANTYRRAHRAMSTSTSSLFTEVSTCAPPSVCSISTYASDVTTPSTCTTSTSASHSTAGSITSATSSAVAFLGNQNRGPRHEGRHSRRPHLGHLDTISDGNASFFPSEDELPPIRFSQTYEVDMHQIGSKGAFSTVFLGHNKHTGDQVAVKMIQREKLSPVEDKAVFDEVSILRKLQEAKEIYGPDAGRGVIRLIDFFATSRVFYIVTEFMDGGDMYDRLELCGRFLEKDVRAVIHSILKTVDYMHSNHIAHRDLKPENLLLRTPSSPDENSTGVSGGGDDSHRRGGSSSGRRRRRPPLSKHEVKVADFGLAAHVERPRSLIERCGTPMYVAPEVLRGVPYDQSCDLWSIGVMVYFFLSGCPPFMDRRKQGLYQKIVTGSFSFANEGWDSISHDAKDFIAACLIVNPKDRITAEEALCHPWFDELA